MTIAGKHFDPLVGLDTHIILIPSPAGPIPTPLPHPYVGMVFDPMDYVPKLGATVYINGVPRATAGSNGQALPPHIPMGGPFAKPPTNESEVFMGSSTVLSDGEPQAFLGMPVLSCQDIGMPAPPRPKKKAVTKSLLLPTTVLLSIPAGGLVLIGGPPTISMTAMGMKALGAAGKWAAKKLAKLKKVRKLLRKLKRAKKAFSDKLHDLAEKQMKKLGLGDGARNAVHKAICTVTGHPVDVATGKVFTDKVDFEFPGPIPLKWERTWFSTSSYQGPLGHGWHHSYDMSLRIFDDVVLLRTSDGRHIGLPRLKAGEEYFEPTERLTFFEERGSYAIRNVDDGLTYRFDGWVRATGERKLSQIKNRTDQSLHFKYDPHSRLSQIVDAAGRVFELQSDTQGRLIAITAPHPADSKQRLLLVRYAYDDWGNLYSVTDALGQRATFLYDEHLLIKETDRNGLSFYFKYDGKSPTAKCLRTWGDGGIYDHKLSYQPELGITLVENSLGHVTKYVHRNGVVIQTTDALGAVTKTEYGEHQHVLAEVDALGQITTYKYDARGNLLQSKAPDGATISIEYGALDLPILATDAVGGTRQWARDTIGRVTERTDPLGNKTQYQYYGPWLVGIVDASGGHTALSYHPSSSDLIEITDPSGASTKYSYDGLGRITTVTDANGNVQSRNYDALGQLTSVTEPDGNSRLLEYDREGNVTHAKDQHHDVTFRYQGMGRLATRSEAGTSVHFNYDTEEQLIGIVNEHGLVYQFKLSPTGEVTEESGFDGLMRAYLRDPAGRVTRVNRPGERFSNYKYDPAGRVLETKHSDGSVEVFGYRPDGLLMAAQNAAASIQFERDALGHVLKESNGAHAVESEYNPLGLRIQLRSTLGANQTIARNKLGDVLSVSESNSQFQAQFTRDKLGLELERTLPGGIRSKWDRDKLGRPTRHSVFHGQNALRATGYHWEPNDRLRRVIDGFKGPTEYTHDALGNLAAARYPDGTVDLRMPDAVGNLFKTEARKDRKYGAAGQLLESTDKRGTTHYAYDVEGNLIRKTEPNGRIWHYTWNAAGMLACVIRPDRSEVTFAYDALGRRVAKTYRGQTTRWVWDGNNPLHEWVEGKLLPLAPPAETPLWSADAEVKKREAELQNHLSQGPPQASTIAPSANSNSAAPTPSNDNFTTSTTPSAEPNRRGTKDAPITWLFEPESFAPMAKLSGGKSSAIITDYLGTPVLMTDEAGNAVWSAQISVYGELRDVEGDKFACPFRWPGQYEDAETGLYYNRFRYYDPEAGQYASQDPIRLAGGSQLHAYVHDPLIGLDPQGLTGCTTGRTPHRQTPRIETGNLKEGWTHIDARHIGGHHPKGPGDLFAKGTTQAQVDEAAKLLVAKGKRISDPAERIQSFEKRMKVNGKRDRIRVVVDSDDGNRVISIFPVRSE